MSDYGPKTFTCLKCNGSGQMKAAIPYGGGKKEMVTCYCGGEGKVDARIHSIQVQTKASHAQYKARHNYSR